VRPLGNVQIRFCPIDACQAHSYRTCIFNRPFRDRLEQWSRIAPRLHLWQYSVNFSHYLAPFPNYDALISDIPMFHQAGVSGLFIEGAVSEGGGGDDAELRSYLAARLLWKPDVDAMAEIREFLDAVYGPAAPVMRDYFALRQHEVRRKEHLWIDQNVDARYLTRDFLKHGRALLDRASLKAADEAARRRIERHLLSIDYVETIREKRCWLQGASYGPAEPGRVNSDTRNLLRMAEELGVTHFREGYPIHRQERDWGDLAARYAAVVLTNGAAHATVVPELQGRIIALGRRNRLRVPDPGELAYPRAGGICLSLSGTVIAWQVESAARETVALTGRSDSGHALRMRIRVAGNTLRIEASVSNPGDAPLRTVILCRAEFTGGPSREAVLTYRDGAGTERERRIRLDDSGADGGAIFNGHELPQQDWTLACEDSALSVRNRFRANEVAHCAFSWSFRGTAGLNLNLVVESPEVELAPGQQVALTSEYE
jgi:hypothetical protein